MIKLLLGGSPCTFWSIAQSKNRETTAAGQGWELFKNYLIAKEKFQPDFFLYENNWSASKAIKEQIQQELGCELMRINSRLVSAQNRDRFYVFNWDVEMPEDRGIMLRDILETGEPLNTTEDEEKARCIRATCYKDGIRNLVANNIDRKTAVAERVGTLPKSDGTVSESKQFRVYSQEGKSTTLCGEGGGLVAKTGLYAIPYAVGYRSRKDETGKNVKRFEGGYDEKANCLTTAQADSMVAIPQIAVKVGLYPNKNGELRECQSKALYSTEGKGRVLTSTYGGLGVQTGLYAIESNKPSYTVKDGYITIKGKKYPIKLKDGNYIIRKLTPVECERLQTLPDEFTAAVSNTQRYRGLGNGWTAEVIIHILQGALKDVPKDEKIVVLSMYDGIGTGRYCLDKMGFTNIEYHAYEIDKYAIKVAMSNYPDIIQHGDAFQVRENDWKLEGYKWTKKPCAK